MKHLFVPYDIALIAKEKGFDEFCLTKFEPKLYTKPNGDQILSAIIKTTFLNGIPKHYEDGGFEGYKNSSKDMFGAKCVAAPLYQQLIDWFESKDINITVKKIHLNHYEVFINKAYLTDIIYYTEFEKVYTKRFESKYEAYNEAFEEAFKLIK